MKRGLDECKQDCLPEVFNQKEVIVVHQVQSNEQEGITVFKKKSLFINVAHIFPTCF